MSKKYLVLAGNIGAGKSTLVEMICRRLGWNPYYEPVTQNPYLEKFYTDMKRWAFHSQVYFLTHRVESHRSLAGNPHSVVQDRSIYEDAEVFARNLFEQGHMSREDFNTYSDLYRVFTSLLPVPDLVVYIRASVKTLKNRIEGRGRDFEQDIEDTYLSNLNRLYERWIESFTLSRILIIPGDSLDFVTNPEDLELILDRITAALQGKQPPLFPEQIQV